MKKQKIAKRLSRYSSFALAIAGVSEADGQVVYTDVNPDFMGNAGSQYLIDMDNNGNIDFALSNSASGSSFYLYISANPYYSNAILGSVGTYYNYPFALSSGENISAGANGSFLAGSSTLNYNGVLGNWIGVTNKYLGVRFDIGGQAHYGWVRLDVNSDATFVVKDYAYEATPNVGILAGNLSIKQSDFVGFSFYPNPVQKTLVLKANNPIDKIVVYDLLGKQVFLETPRLSEHHLDVSNLVPGTYIMEVSIDGNNKSFRLLKE